MEPEIETVTVDTTSDETNYVAAIGGIFLASAAITAGVCFGKFLSDVVTRRLDARKSKSDRDEPKND
jgi:hypothetical protein